MTEFFRVRIAGKRQITLPQLMLHQLGLHEGDELEFTVEEGVIRAVRPFRLVPLDYFSPDVRRVLDRQAAEMAAGVDGGYLQLTQEPTRSEPSPAAMQAALNAGEETAGAI